MHIANDPEPAPTPTHLWRVLRAYIVSLFDLFGDPLALARRVWITRDEHRRLCDVLRALEIMLRRLVFLDALTTPAPAPSAPRPRAPRPRRDTFNLESTVSWQASFDLGLKRPCAPRRDANTPAPQRAQLPNAAFTRPLALRYEALLRGFNDPAPLAQRMARLLARDRKRQYKLLSSVRKTDRAKPFFREAALTITLARDVFQAWLTAQCAAPRADSS